MDEDCVAYKIGATSLICPNEAAYDLVKSVGSAVSEAYPVCETHLGAAVAKLSRELPVTVHYLGDDED